MKTMIVVLGFIMASTAALANKPPDAAMLTADAVQTALSHYFAQPKHANELIYRSMFTPGLRHSVGETNITVITRTDIPKGKDVSLVRISEVAIRETDSVPPQVTIVVRLVTWVEKGQSDLVPMHAFPTYEMALDSEGKMKVTKETFVIE
jgi:hypothetical protein